MPTDTGHWITLDGNHVFISGAAGSVPRRLQPEAGEKTRFSKAELERHLIQHHQEVGGKGTYTAQDEKQLNQAAGAGDPFTFHKKLPTEIKEFQAGRPELRSMFKVSGNAAEAGGADAFGELGDRYLDIAEAKAGSPLRAAKATARASNDPEVKFLAAVHDNLPEGRFSGNTIAAKGLRVGDQFAIGGSKFRVAEDDQGMRVLEGGKDYPETPVDALGQIPVDKGSFKPGKRQRLEAAPFSRAVILDDTRCYGFQPAITLGQSYPKEVKGQPCDYQWKEAFIPGIWRDAQGRLDSYPQDRIDGMLKSFARQKEKNLLPFLPPNHKERAGDRNFGFVIDARKNSRGGLELLHQLIGEDAKKAAARNQTSICILPKVQTQDGEIIEDFIDHNAILPDPAITELKDFEPAFAASRWGDVPAEVLTFASERSEAMPLTAQQKERLLKLVPSGAQLPDEPTPDYFIGLVETSHQAVTAKAAEAQTAFSRAQAAETKAAEFSRQLQPVPPSATELFFASRAVRAERQKAIDAGEITPAVADKLEARFLGKAVDHDKITMSRTPTVEDAPLSSGFARLLDVYESLHGNKPAPPVGDSGKAHYFGREVPGAEDAASLKKVADDGLAVGKAYNDEQVARMGK